MDGLATAIGTIESPTCEVEGCPRSALKGAGSCILHDPDAGKSVQDFNEALADAVEDCSGSTLSALGQVVMSQPTALNASGFVFPEGAEVEFLDMAQGLCLDGATFYAALALMGADFPLGVSARDTTFNGDVHFTECEFDSFIADNATFKGKVVFQDCRLTASFFTGSTTFADDAFFSFSTFETGLFQRVEFKRQADFTEATVVEGLAFEDCCLGPDICFGATDLKGSLTFRDCNTSGDISVAGSRLGARLLFENLAHTGYVDFRRVRIGPDGEAVFLRVSMERVLMVGTSVERAEFQDVTWPEVSTAGSTRRAVADEVHWPGVESAGLAYGNTQFGQASMAELELLYRQLKKVFDDRADYETAGDFHVGEFEAKLRSSRLPRSSRLLISIYRAISFYGERWLRPLVILVTWLFLFTAVMLFAGVEISKHPIEYGLTGTFDLGLLINDAWLTFLYGVQVAFAMRPADVTYTGWPARTMVVLTSLVGPSLVALLVLALRRQTKR